MISEQALAPNSVQAWLLTSLLSISYEDRKEVLPELLAFDACEFVLELLGVSSERSYTLTFRASFESIGNV